EQIRSGVVTAPASKVPGSHNPEIGDPASGPPRPRRAPGTTAVGMAATRVRPRSRGRGRSVTDRESVPRNRGRSASRSPLLLDSDLDRDTVQVFDVGLDTRHDGRFKGRSVLTFRDSGGIAGREFDLFGRFPRTAFHFELLGRSIDCDDLTLEF